MEIRFSGPASEDHVAVEVAFGGDDGGETLLRDRQEMVGVSGRPNRFDGDDDRPAGAVLEADRHRQPTCELSVNLAFGGSGANRAPTDEVRDELR